MASMKLARTPKLLETPFPTSDASTKSSSSKRSIPLNLLSTFLIKSMLSRKITQSTRLHMLKALQLLSKDFTNLQMKIRTALQEHFGECGEITRISIPTDREFGEVKGIAYIGKALEAILCMWTWPSLREIVLVSAVVVVVAVVVVIVVAGIDCQVYSPHMFYSGKFSFQSVRTFLS